MSGLLKNALTTLVSASNDAQSNLYKVRFSGGILDSEFEDMKEQLTIRCSGITPPMPIQDSYQVKYITAYADRPVPKIGLSRTFSLTFRMDSYWNVYKVLLSLQRKFFDPSKSWVNINFLNSSGQPDSSKFFTTEVNYLEEAEVDDTSLGNPLYKFNYCWIESITPPSFNTNSSDAVTVTCQINFLEMEDFKSGFLGDGSSSDSLAGNVSAISYK